MDKQIIIISYQQQIGSFLFCLLFHTQNSSAHAHDVVTFVLDNRYTEHDV